MTGQPLSVDDAYRLGFVARICTDTEALHAEADRYAGWFADAAPDAIRLGRKAFAVLADLPAPQALDAAQLFNLAFFLGDELPEGAGAFLEKRRRRGRTAMAEAYLVDAVRTPVGKRGGALSAIHPADLGATVIEALLARTGADPDAVDDVVWGCVGQMGPQASNIGRITALSAGPARARPGDDGGPAVRVLAAGRALRGPGGDGRRPGPRVAGGVEVMSQVPIASPTTIGLEHGMAHPRGGERWRRRFGDQAITQFRGAELIAEKWDLSRSAMEAFALGEPPASAGGRPTADAFDEEMVSVAGLDHDEGPRRGSTAAALAALDPISEGGRLTAALASQISDGAAALLVASAEAVRRHGLRPLPASTPWPWSAPTPCSCSPVRSRPPRPRCAAPGCRWTRSGRSRSTRRSPPSSWPGRPRPAPTSDSTNPQGGAIALGHPLGATGARLMTTMLHRMRRDGTRYGLQTMCEGGGMANATILELL